MAPRPAVDGLRVRLRPTVGAWRWGFVSLGVVSLVLGYIGLAQHVPTIADLPGRPADLVYYDLQLFVLGSPPVDTGARLPLALDIARFAAPAVTVYAFIEAARTLFTVQLSRQRSRRLRGHDVVCGGGPIADAVVGRLVAQRHRVVVMSPDGGERSFRRGVLFVPGSPTDPEVLRDAGVGRARVLYVCTEDSAQNLAVADLVAHLRRHRPDPLQVHVQVDDPELCLALQARQLGLPAVRRTLVNFFSPDELAARSILDRRPLPSAAGPRPPTVMVVGASWFGMALVVEAARRWRLCGDGRRAKLPITMVDSRADVVIQRLCRLYPFVADTCEFTTDLVDVRQLLDGDLGPELPDRVYLCSDDDAVSLKLALTMDQFWRRGGTSVIVPLRQLGRLGVLFDSVEPMLEGVQGALHFFDAVEAGSDPSLIEDSLVERLARAAHEHYLTTQLRAGVAMGSRPAMRPWSELSAEFKEANRSQAVHVGTKLRTIGCALAPNPIWGEPERFSPQTVHYLAKLEHERWRSWMERSHGVRGTKAESTRHPDLVDWSQLDEAARQKDRDYVTALPTILADAGFQIVRVRPAAIP